MTGADTLLPPNARPVERALEQALRAEIDLWAVETLWDPWRCPVHLLPFLAWGLAITHWDADWSVAEKRAAIAGALPFHFRKGTRAALREVLDRFDPLLRLVEWFEDRDVLAPHTFRLELPLNAETDVVYDEALVAALLRDIAVTKPLRSHMFAVHRLRAALPVFAAAAAAALGVLRQDGFADAEAASDPYWANLLQTEEGEPLRSAEGPFLEVA